MPFQTEKLIDIFSYHPPTKEQTGIYQKINEAFLECAEKVNLLMPDGPGATAAMRKLADSRMAANAAVALEGKF